MTYRVYAFSKSTRNMAVLISYMHRFQNVPRLGGQLRSLSTETQPRFKFSSAAAINRSNTISKDSNYTTTYTTPRIPLSLVRRPPGGSRRSIMSSVLRIEPEKINKLREFSACDVCASSLLPASALN